MLGGGVAGGGVRGSLALLGRVSAWKPLSRPCPAGMAALEHSALRLTWVLGADRCGGGMQGEEPLHRHWGLAGGAGDGSR